MTTTTKNNIAQILLVIGINYPNFKATQDTIMVYYDFLKDIPAEELKLGVQQCLTQPERAFAPTVGEIRGAVMKLRNRAENVPSTEEAWKEVKRKMVEVGSYRIPTWNHPLIEQTVKVFGWKTLCLSEEEGYDRHAFMKAYETLKQRAGEESMMLPEVRGYLEANGAQRLAPASAMKLLADKFNTRRGKP